MTYNDWVTKNPPIIYLFDDRIEIYSVGTLPEGLSEEGFYKGRSRHRSKELFDLFDRFGLGEHTGHGVPLILAKYNNDKSIFTIDADSVTVTFRYPEIVKRELEKNRIVVKDGELNDELNDELNLSNNASKVLKLIKTNAHSTALEMSNILNVSTRTVDRAIDELKKQNIIVREGSYKTGFWKVKN